MTRLTLAIELRASGPVHARNPEDCPEPSSDLTAVRPGNRRDPLHDQHRQQEQRQISEVEQGARPRAQREPQGHGERRSRADREIRPAGRESRQAVQHHDAHRRERQVLRVVHRMGEVPRRGGQQDHREDPTPGPEQTAGEQAREDDADPPEHGVHSVSQDVPVDVVLAFEPGRDDIEESRIHRAVVRLLARHLPLVVFENGPTVLVPIQFRPTSCRNQRMLSP